MKISSVSPLSPGSPPIRKEPHPFLKPEIAILISRLICAQNFEAKRENLNTLKKVVELSGSWDSFLDFLLERIKRYPLKSLLAAYLHIMSFYNLSKCFKGLHQFLDFGEETKIMNHSILALFYPSLSAEKKRPLKERKAALRYDDSTIENVFALMHVFLLEKTNISKRNYEIYLKLSANGSKAIKTACETWLINNLENFELSELLPHIKRYKLQRLAEVILDRELKSNESK